MNVVSITGRLVADPELRRTQDGTPVTNFTLAVQRPYKDANGEHPADFPSVVVWRTSAEYIVKYARKGTKIGVVGRLEMRKYTDKNGDARTAWEIKASDVEIIAEPKKVEPDGAYDYSAPNDSYKAIDTDDSDIPF